MNPPPAQASPRILCVGIPVRDLTFRVHSMPGHGSKVNASHFAEICGGNALNAAIGIVRLGGRATLCGPMGDAGESSSRFIFDKLAEEGIETNRLVHMPGLVTPISAIMIDPSGERTIAVFRDPKLWQVQLPGIDTLLEDCSAILTESRCAGFCIDLCTEARRRGIPVIVDADRAMSPREGLLSASSHLVFSSESLRETAGIELRQALRFASAAAALKCTRFGGAFAAPQRADVERLLG
jgi:sugar/nucleoside kinase (ribokinase family)